MFGKLGREGKGLEREQERRESSIEKVPKSQKRGGVSKQSCMLKYPWSVVQDTDNTVA